MGVPEVLLGESAHLGTTFHLKKSETVPKGLRRIVAEELASALEQLSGPPESIDAGVHEARKSIKKVRAVLRLLRPVYGSAYRRENAALREIGRTLSEVRDAQAMLETLDHLSEAISDFPRLDATRQSLTERKEQIDRQFEASGELAGLQEELRRAIDRADRWAYQDADLTLLCQGLAMAVRSGRKAAETAYADPRPEHFHEWRKQAKDLRYQIELVRKAWPNVLEGYLASVKDLEEKLGNDHNLAVLSGIVHAHPEQFEEETRHRLLADIDAYQDKLRKEAKLLGERLYGEKPRHWARRLEVSWHAWRKEKVH